MLLCSKSSSGSWLALVGMRLEAQTLPGGLRKGTTHGSKSPVPQGRRGTACSGESQPGLLTDGVTHPHTLKSPLRSRRALSSNQIRLGPILAERLTAGVRDLEASQADSPHSCGRRQRSPVVSILRLLLRHRLWAVLFHSFSRSSRFGLRGGGRSVLFFVLLVEEAHFVM